MIEYSTGLKKTEKKLSAFEATIDLIFFCTVFENASESTIVEVASTINGGTSEHLVYL